MADYLKSAFNYLTSSPLVKNDNELIGSTVSVGTLSLRIKRVIAEGGYGLVYEAQDGTKGLSYALKRMLSHDKNTTDLILREISFLKQLSGHPNIMEFVGAASTTKDKQKGTGTEYLIATELCRGGQLSDYLPAPHQDRPLPPSAIIQIMHQTCRAVQHMHCQNPPIMHRDLKIENLLLSDKFIIKLCDFGSASTVTYNPDTSWTALKRGTVQEEALGCILFYLTCTFHPFEESAKLAILNAKYNLPAGTSEHTVFHGLIRQMLLLDPRQRPTVTDVLGELSELASMREIRVIGPVSLLAEMNKRRFGLNTATSKPAPSTPVSYIIYSTHIIYIYIIYIILYIYIYIYIYIILYIICGLKMLSEMSKCFSLALLMMFAIK
ncbi:Cyclin-G-associated kinase [Fasciola gigantica]|uniref:Cyclin-G-associated kinase n=1 Tax=Fasciola gigantica TaxID=46835 RepID=A0A504YTZ7_FASGI|nr:Cyclin-G-associated kinase [Fasciola gigantica]